MASPWTHPVFSVGDATYAWGDVAAFARRDGRWDNLVRQARDALACERAGHVASREAAKKAATAFRYRRRLITAEETEAWLRARHIGVDEWMGWVRRTVALAAHGSPATGHDGVDVDAGDIDHLLWVTGRCGGLLDDFAVALAQRVAAHVRLTGTRPATDDEADDAVERLRAVAVTPAAVEAEVGRRQLDWLGVELEEGCFATEDAAREALLCVRHDRLALSEVCKVAGAPYVRRHARLEELDPSARAAVLGARLSELVGPLAGEHGFAVARVEAKVVPSVADPDVARRAADAVLGATLRREVEERVRWHDRA